MARNRVNALQISDDDCPRGLYISGARERLKPMTEISADRQACILNILRKESTASTKRIIELASSPEFQEICRDCRSGVEVYEMAMKLQRAGVITRSLGRGGFVWALVEQGEQAL